MPSETQTFLVGKEPCFLGPKELWQDLTEKKMLFQVSLHMNLSEEPPFTTRVQNLRQVVSGPTMPIVGLILKFSIWLTH